ncbi:MAG: hypothetical protein D6766_14215, partial [Verrucomicrobia bacterium]
DQFQVRRWTRREGLPGNRVQALLQTPDGFLWVGTASGMARFDGREFAVLTRTYNLDLPEDDCRALAPAGSSAVWMGMQRRLIRFDGRTEVFSLADPGAGRGADLAGGLEALAGWPGMPPLVLAAGRLWRVAQERPGILLPAGPELPSGARVLCLAPQPGRPQAVWAGRTDGLFTWDPQNGWQPASLPPPAAHRPCRWVAVAADGIVWAWMDEANGGRLWRREPDGWAPTPAPSWELPPATNRLLGAIDSRGRVWLGDGGLALHVWDGTRWSRIDLPDGDRADEPLCLAAGRQGEIWIGLARGGLLQLTPLDFPRRTVRHGLPPGPLHVIRPDGTNTVWFGGEGGLTSDPPAASQALPAAWRTLPIHDVLRDRAGRLWLATAAGLRVHAAGSAKVPDLPPALADRPVRRLALDPAGHLWAVGAAGLWREDAGAWSRVPGEPAGRNDLCDLLAARDATVWVAAAGGGLGRWDGTRWEWFDATAGLPSARVRSLGEGPDGRLWVGTDRGLAAFAGGRFVPVLARHGLPDEAIVTVACDAEGALWILHAGGLSRVDPASLKAVLENHSGRLEVRTWGEWEGMDGAHAPDELNLRPAMDAQGRLWLILGTGVRIVPVARPPGSPPPPVAAITRVSFNGRPWWEAFPSQPDTPAPHQRFEEMAAELVMPAGGAELLEVAYAAPWFRAGEPLRFSYRLQGVESSWTVGLPWRTARYANLPPGRYVFEVRVVLPDGTGGPITSWQLALPPRFYQTLWWRVLCVLAVAGLLWAAYRWRLAQAARLQEARRRLALMEQRLRIARDLHDGLGANLTRIRLLAEQPPAPSPEEAAQRFRQLAEGTREAAALLRDMIWTTHPEHDTVRSLVERLQQTAEQLCDPAGVDLQIRLPLELPDTPLDREARLAVFFAVKEALHNLVRHSRATEALLRFQLAPGELRIRLEDNGRGFDPANVKSPDGGGHGLGNMQDRLRQAGGELSIQSVVGQGTVIEVRLPLAPQTGASKPN